MKDKNKQLNRFIAKFYTYQLFTLMGFIIPFIAVMFDKNGLTATQIAICMMAQQFVQFMTEIPSGVIADKYSRRNVLIVGQIITIGAYFLWLIMPHFWGYLLGYICWGIRGSLISGCREAFLFDTLKKFDKRSLYERVNGRSSAFRSGGIMFASVVASYLTKIGFNFSGLIIATMFTSLLSIIALMTIKSVKKFKESEEPENVLSYMQILKKGLRYSWRHTTVFKLLLFMALSPCINIGFMEYSEIFYNELTNDLVKVALIFGINEIMYIIGNTIGEYFKKIPLRFLVLIYFVVGCFDTIAFVIYKYPISIAIIFLDTVIICSAIINVSAKTNDLIPSRVRATILSVRGFIQSLGTFISLFLFGQIVDYFKSYRVGFLSFSSLFVIVMFIFLIILWKDKHLRKRERRLG